MEKQNAKAILDKSKRESLVKEKIKRENKGKIVNETKLRSVYNCG